MSSDSPAATASVVGPFPIGTGRVLLVQANSAVLGAAAGVLAGAVGLGFEVVTQSCPCCSSSAGQALTLWTLVRSQEAADACSAEQLQKLLTQGNSAVTILRDAAAPVLQTWCA